MKKQEAIKELNTKKDKNENVLEIEDYDTGFKCGTRGAYENAINIVKQLDEPEKVVLTKEEAEWIDKLTDFYSLPDALYYITRCGYGYLFVFEMCGKTYELPVDSDATYGELRELKERLVNAVIYGYEVKKEKLYTVELPNSNYQGSGHFVLHKDEKGKVFIDWHYSENWKKLDGVELTESEIKEGFAWAWQFAEEVNNNDD